eukprot:1184181-Prorocentrum_minimum.AAC.1
MQLLQLGGSAAPLLGGIWGFYFALRDLGGGRRGGGGWLPPTGYNRIIILMGNIIAFRHLIGPSVEIRGCQQLRKLKSPPRRNRKKSKKPVTLVGRIFDFSSNPKGNLCHINGPNILDSTFHSTLYSTLSGF